MPRVEDLNVETLTPEQKAVHARIAGSRGGVVRGPFAIWMRNPAIADAADKLGTTLRNGKLDVRLFELMVLVIARHWTAQYEWYAHRRLAQEAGLSQAVIDAIAAGKRPTTMQPDEEAVYTFCTELITTKQVSDKTFQMAKDKFGERGVVDLIGVTGYYGLVSMLLNVDRYPLPQGVQPELRPVPQSSAP